MKTLLLIIGVLFVTTQAQINDSSTAQDQAPKKETAQPISPNPGFSVHHALSFGLASSKFIGTGTQSTYSTMMQYQFNAPVTLNLNFNLPIQSSFSTTQNLTSSNMQNLNYFKSMPWDVSLTWKPKENLLLRFSVEHQTYGMFSDQNTPYGFDMFGNKISK